MPLGRERELRRGMLPDVHSIRQTDRGEDQPLGRNVIIYKGQGFVKKGMGESLFKEHQTVRDLHSEVNRILGYSLTDKIFNDPNGDLLETQYAQPATLLSNRSEEAVGEENKIPDFIQPFAYAAGNSLGEYSALIRVGAISFRDAIALVAKRGVYMHEAHKENPGRLATPFLARNDDEKLAEQLLIAEEIAQQTKIVKCLVNSRLQTVYGGTDEEMNEAAALFKKYGIRLSPLKTIGAFHHPQLMAPARARLEPEIDNTEIHDANVPIIANTTGKTIQTAVEIRQELKDQMTNPVLWLPSMMYLHDQGFDTSMEVGEKSSFLDLLLDHPAYAGATLAPIIVGGVTLGWKLVHPHNHKE